jgi:putative oxidoreductase
MIHDLGLLAARLALGLSFASHGTQKAFGWFDGPGPENAAAFLEGLGFKPGEQYASAAAYSEIGAGLAIALGLGGAAGPAGVISSMLVAQTSVHAKNGFFAQNGGVELGVVYGSAALALASTGYGKLSLDHAFGLDEKFRHPALTLLALAGGVAAGYLILGQRDHTPPPGTMATPTIAGGASANGTASGTAPQPAKS